MSEVTITSPTFKLPPVSDTNLWNCWDVPPHGEWLVHLLRCVSFYYTVLCSFPEMIALIALLCSLREAGQCLISKHFCQVLLVWCLCATGQLKVPPELWTLPGWNWRSRASIGWCVQACPHAKDPYPGGTNKWVRRKLIGSPCVMDQTPASPGAHLAQTDPTLLFLSWLCSEVQPGDRKTSVPYQRGWLSTGGRGGRSQRYHAWLPDN